MAARASKRVSERETTVRHGFIRSPRAADDDAAPPPLARLMKGSKGGAIRIRLYLALLWQAGGGDERHSVDFPARAFAELLDLPDPERRGDRRVREAIKLFEKERLLRTERRPGQPSVLALLQEDGSGDPYTRPGAHASQAKERGEVARSHLFVRLPAGFWTHGWALALSAPALATLLVLLEATRNGAMADKWISPSERRWYGLSDDTWTRGIAELARYGLVEVAKKPVSEDFGWRRVRNAYTVRHDLLAQPPSSMQEHFRPRPLRRKSSFGSRPGKPVASDDVAGLDWPPRARPGRRSARASLLMIPLAHRERVIASVIGRATVGTSASATKRGLAGAAGGGAQADSAPVAYVCKSAILHAASQPRIRRGPPANSAHSDFSVPTGRRTDVWPAVASLSSLSLASSMFGDRQPNADVWVSSGCGRASRSRQRSPVSRLAAIIIIRRAAPRLPQRPK